MEGQLRAEKTESLDDLKVKRKTELEAFFENDHLYQRLRSFEYPIISEDILELDPYKRYTTNDVAEILIQYPYLTDPESGQSYINDPSRLRWWLMEKHEDNLLHYLRVEKTGKNWTWDVYAIVRAKIVSILRYVKGYTQKQIKVDSTGLAPKTPRISAENVISLIRNGDIHNINNFDILKEAFIQYAIMSEQKLQEVEKIKDLILDISEAYEELKEQNQKLSAELSDTKMLLSSNSEVYKELKEQNQTFSTELIETKKIISSNSEALEKINRDDIEKRNEQLNRELILIRQRDQLRRQYRLEAISEWDKRGKWKNLFATEMEKERFIQDYVSKKEAENPS